MNIRLASSVIFLLATVPAVCLAVDTTSTTAPVLVNPLGTTDVRFIFARVISGALSIVGSFALLMFVYGGVLWLTSRGETKAIQKGKDTLTWATLGLVIIFSSYVVVNALLTGLLTGSAA